MGKLRHRKERGGGEGATVVQFLPLLSRTLMVGAACLCFNLTLNRQAQVAAQYTFSIQYDLYGQNLKYFSALINVS
jgi:hypothetical protein